jgi:hypothetical protein
MNRPLKIDDRLMKEILAFQREELTGAKIYGKLASINKNSENSKVLADMAKAEHRHYAFWKSLSGKDQHPYRAKAFVFFVLGRFLGLTFTLKMLERGEKDASEGYHKVAHLVPEAIEMGNEEEAHEEALIGMIEEEGLA